MPGGRPSKYNQELISKAPEYLREWEEIGDLIPSQSGLADFLNISISCLENWAKDAGKPEFLGVLDAIECKQRRILINKGLGGEFNSNICKLVLSKHGFSDSKQVDNISSDGSMTPKNFNDFYSETDP